jgi:poly-gamma-glutamate synthesis protein (capsule biosynthesis protein)
MMGVVYMNLVIKRFFAYFFALSVGLSSSLAAKPNQPETLPKAPKSVTLTAVGDNLIHDVIYWQARSGDSYDFSPVYRRVKKQIEAADIAFINQETPMVPDEPPSSYPQFNTPVEMAANLQETGFDVLGIANNHMLDRGVSGLAKTIGTIRSTDGLTLTGAYLNAKEQQTIPIVESGGLRFSFLGFTEHTNGIPLPQDSSGMIVYTDNIARIRILTALARQRSDVVVVSVHWGNENSFTLTPHQEALAQELADLGAHLIIGTHPHVLQPATYLNRKLGGKTLVLYSLGNFVSAQITPANLVAAMAEVTFTPGTTKTAPITITHSFTPIVTHYEGSFRGLSIYPLAEYTDALAAKHGVRQRGYAFTREVIDGILRETIGVAG